MITDWWKDMTVPAKIALTIVVAALIAWAAASFSSPEAKADGLYDPYVPVPILDWCPGGGFQGGGWGGYCDGRLYADGTKWHTNNVLGFWSPIQCVHSGPPGQQPPAPNGCGMGVVQR